MCVCVCEYGWVYVAVYLRSCVSEVVLRSCVFARPRVRACMHMFVHVLCVCHPSGPHATSYTHTHATSTHTPYTFWHLCRMCSTPSFICVSVHTLIGHSLDIYKNTLAVPTYTQTPKYIHPFRRVCRIGSRDCSTKYALDCMCIALRRACMHLVHACRNPQ